MVATSAWSKPDLEEAVTKLEFCAGVGNCNIGVSDLERRPK